MSVPLLIAGYSGPPPLTLVRAVTTWSLNLSAVFEVALAAGYLWAVRAVRRAGTVWPPARERAFVFGGVGTLVIITCGPIGSYAGVLFWARAAQNVALLMIVPLFLALGAPLTLLRELLPEPARAALGRVLTSRFARGATFPLVITVLFVTPLPMVYLTPIYPATLEHTWAGVLAALWLLSAGWCYFWTRFRIDPTPRTDPFLVSLGISAAEVVLDGALGLVVWLGPLLAPHYYEQLARPWGPSTRLDQIIGAGVLWIGGDLAGLPFLGVVLRRMTTEDAQEAALVDAELDRQDSEREQAAADAADTTGETGDSPAAPPRLWWEDHPELAERFRRR
ncbi:MAG TPA: cytochrome c oxidase assembly protein [Pseudonocardia sp.]|jgi:cytochrome c oxidase assembly factor CtaG|nr:cytochrome c oxidase assembly protein [Pseudonocardia sp.]